MTVERTAVSALRFFIYWRAQRPMVMSDRWRREQAQESTRIDFQGPQMQWPVQKIQNDKGWFNRIQLRRSA